MKSNFNSRKRIILFNRSQTSIGRRKFNFCLQCEWSFGLIRFDSIRPVSTTDTWCFFTHFNFFLLFANMNNVQKYFYDNCLHFFYIYPSKVSLNMYITNYNNWPEQMEKSNNFSCYSVNNFVHKLLPPIALNSCMRNKIYSIFDQILFSDVFEFFSIKCFCFCSVLFCFVCIVSKYDR